MINVGQTDGDEGVLINANQKHEEGLCYPHALDSVHEVGVCYGDPMHMMSV